MTQPRSSLAIALQDYKGIRPGIALTIAAVALIAALVVGIAHIALLGSAASTITEGERTLATLNRYNAALEVWRQMAVLPDSALPFEAQRQLRDSLAKGLRADLVVLQGEMNDSTDRALVQQIIGDLQRPEAGAKTSGLDLGVAGREAMILLSGRQDSALFNAAARSQRSQIFAAIVLGLTIVAAGVLIVPMSWMYVRYKRGVPPGM